MRPHTLELDSKKEREKKMASAATLTPSGEHPLNSGFTLYLMRRQKPSRKTAAKKEAASESAPTEGGANNAEESSSQQHQAQQQQPHDSSLEDYEKAIKKIATFNTVEGFWRIYGHLARPSEVPHSTDFHMFREGIKPVWEDPANKRGGKLVVKVKKGLGARYWESLLLAVIGEQFGDMANEVCGVVISVRHNEDVISLWTRNSDNTEGLQKMRETLKRSLKLPGFVPIDYKRHDTAESAAAAAAAAPYSSGSSRQTDGAGRGQPAWRTRPPQATGVPSVTSTGNDWRS